MIESVSLVGKINAANIKGETNKGIEYIEPVLQEKSTTPTELIQEIIPDENFNGLSKVQVNAIPNEYIIPSGTKDIGTNGIYDVKEFENVNVQTSGVDLNDYFNQTPTSSDLVETRSWVRNNYVIKSGELIIPNTISSIEGLCTGSNSTDTLKYAPKIICNNNITNMKSLYSYNGSEYIDLSGLNTSNVNNIYYMFYQCKSLKKLDTSNFDLRNLSSATSTRSYFASYCYNLEEIILTKNITKSLYRFFQYDCSLKKLILLKEDEICVYDSTFLNCYHMDGTVDETYNPQGLKDGRIYVPDNLVNAYKNANGWSTYADQILPLSSLEE